MSFCPSCGSPAPAALVDGVEVPCCPVHGAAWRLVRTGSTVEVAVVRSGRVLLCKRATEPYAGCWSLPGGFVNPGEAPEEAARREAREEAGVETELIALLGLYPSSYRKDEWLTVATYLARSSGEPVADGKETSAVAWFSEGELPFLPWNQEERVRAALWRAGC